MYEKHYIKSTCIDFAIRIVRLHRYLLEQKKETVLSKQILRSGTSIGANLAEGEMAQSTADFIAKMQIALKEANETSYWLEILHKTDCITFEQYESMNNDLSRIIGIFVNVLKKIKTKDTK